MSEEHILAEAYEHRSEASCLEVDLALGRDAESLLKPKMRSGRCDFRELCQQEHTCPKGKRFVRSAICEIFLSNSLIRF